ncbi:MAG: indolepyruvate ferredoxin oxidoreductase, partial [Desulfobacteraceae bacterium]
MNKCIETQNEKQLMMGNVAIARGALEAGLKLATAYPGTPSSEIIETLASVTQKHSLYVEWSVNEIVAMQTAAAGSLAGIRSLCAMKQNGLNLAADFLLHLAGSGTRAGILLVTCDDPGALSSINEADSRYFAKMFELPLLEPADFQQAKDLTKWAFDLSEQLNQVIILRSVTRLSHASGNVSLGPIPTEKPKAVFDFNGPFMDPWSGVVASFPVSYKHREQQKKLEIAIHTFESSPFNTYTGPKKPKLLIIASSSGCLYAREAISLLRLEDKVGLLSLATVWPLPPKTIAKYCHPAGQILVIEEQSPFLEESIMVLLQQLFISLGYKKVYGRKTHTIPSTGELTTDIVINALRQIFNIQYVPVSKSYQKKLKNLIEVGELEERDVTFCPGCPHRASYWTIYHVLKKNKGDAFICGDVGCYTLDMRKTGLKTIKTILGMGSSLG